MAAPMPATRGPIATLRHQAKYDRLRLIANLGLALAVLVTIVQIPFFVGEGGLDNVFEVTWHHLWGLVVLLGISWFTRTVGPRTLLVYWLLGVYLVSSLALLIGVPILDVLGETQLTTDFLLPFSEEVLKAMPVLVYFVITARRRGFQAAAIDGLLLGFAVGAGFAFNEDLLVGRSVGHGVGSLYGVFFPSMAALGGGFFGGPFRWAMGHAGWTALTGLGIGLTFQFRRWWYVSWIPMVGLFTLATWDHMMVNYRGDFDGLFDALLLSGNLPIIVLLLGLFATVAIDLAILFRTGRKYDHFRPLRITGRLDTMESESIGELIVQAIAARDYNRHRRGALYALFQSRGDPRGGAAMFGQLSKMAAVANLDLDRAGPTPAGGATSADPEASPPDEEDGTEPDATDPGDENEDADATDPERDVADADDDAEPKDGSDVDDTPIGPGDDEGVEDRRDPSDGSPAP